MHGFMDLWIHECMNVCVLLCCLPDASLRWWSPSYQRAVPLLLACKITGDTPGEYNLTFSVTNSAGLTSRIVRRLIIKAVCPEGESLCSDKVGTCMPAVARGFFDTSSGPCCSA
jgi:hypothetical protein